MNLRVIASAEHPQGLPLGRHPVHWHGKPDLAHPPQAALLALEAGQLARAIQALLIQEAKAG